jgi:hypothetical protein
MALTEDNVVTATAISDAAASGFSTIELQRNRMEAVRIAKEVLMENWRAQPAGTETPPPTQITDFADSLMSYVVG